ncbi:LuxR C-terminal-related transcriptional regulator [Arhodomonas sp. SL1]|uniref:LuxR C-terminal-related transcriptional regulator n=1 Tax=Arhodomonas sp. SL1 TaxID=3425691 RepID=UPI003F882DE5
MARVLIADDHPLMRDALRPVLRELFDGGVEIAEADTVEATLSALDQDRFDLVLFDLCMPGGGDAGALLAARDHADGSPVVVVSHREDAGVVRQCIAAGAAGFIPKSLNTALIRSALRLVVDGGQYFPTWALAEGETPEPAPGSTDISALTRRQRTVLRLLGEGQSNRQIAETLHLSEWTVKAHVSAVLRKLGVSTRVEAALIGRELA